MVFFKQKQRRHTCAQGEVNSEQRVVSSKIRVASNDIGGASSQVDQRVVKSEQ